MWKENHMEEFKTLKAEVQFILTKYPASRDSDEKLYAAYLARHGITTLSVAYFLNNFNQYKVSDFESVTRMRRKIVEQNPSLGPSEKVKSLRQERQLDFYEFIKEN